MTLEAAINENEQRKQMRTQPTCDSVQVLPVSRAVAAGNEAALPRGLSRRVQLTSSVHRSLLSTH